MPADPTEGVRHLGCLVGSTTPVGDLRRVRRVGSSGSARSETGARRLDSLPLIVESDEPLGTRASLFRNSGPRRDGPLLVECPESHNPTERVRSRQLEGPATRER